MIRRLLCLYQSVRETVLVEGVVAVQINKGFKIGRLRTTATVGRESAPGSSQTAHDQ